jgi:hypothetical protein
MRHIMIRKMLETADSETQYLSQLIAMLDKDVLPAFEEAIPEKDHLRKKYNDILDHIDKLSDFYRAYRNEYRSMTTEMRDYPDDDALTDEVFDRITSQCQTLRERFRKVHSRFILAMDQPLIHEQFPHVDFYPDRSVIDFSMTKEKQEHRLTHFCNTYFPRLENFLLTISHSLLRHVYKPTHSYKFFTPRPDKDFMLVLNFIKDNCDFFLAPYVSETFHIWCEENAHLMTNFDAMLKLSMKNENPAKCGDFIYGFGDFSYGLMKYIETKNDGLLRHFLQHPSNAILIENLKTFIRAETITDVSVKFKLIHVISKWREEDLPICIMPPRAYSRI